MAGELILPRAYRSSLQPRQIEVAIKDIKDFFETNLAASLNLWRVSAPLFVPSGEGINDDLNGVERPVSFAVRDDNNAQAEMVQSLAKWKRLALSKYGYEAGEGLYTDMNAVRPDETLDNLHSIYVDQWDWEKIITPESRTRETLEQTVRTIYDVICRTEFHVASRVSGLRPLLPADITIVTSEELLAQYPSLPPRDRERMACEKHKAVFVLGIGANLADGQPHDGRAPDYDDWSSARPDGGVGLNGDILVWHPILERAFEISSMGIRVDPACLLRQLEIRGVSSWKDRPFHRMLLNGKLPQTMGGGIGQSRLCMFLLRCAHIGEVAVGLWPSHMQRTCADAGIFLL